jgi:hypothetical protein
MILRYASISKVGWMPGIMTNVLLQQLSKFVTLALPLGNSYIVEQSEFRS